MSLIQFLNGVITRWRRFQLLIHFIEFPYLSILLLLFVPICSFQKNPSNMSSSSNNTFSISGRITVVKHNINKIRQKWSKT